MKFGVDLQQLKLVNVYSNSGIVILSRYSSSRLPGKALMTIAGKRVLEYIIERAMQVYPLDRIIIATSVEKSDDPIALFAENYGVNIFRGSLDNVSDRFYQAARKQNWDYAVRINGDNIFLDVNVLRDMINLIPKNDFDFISNVKGRTFPKGMSIEIIKLDYYKKLLPIILTKLDYKEHVTLHLYENEELGKCYFYTNQILPEAAGIQMALDTQEDFGRSKIIIEKFKKEHYHYNLIEIYNMLQDINYDK